MNILYEKSASGTVTEVGNRLEKAAGDHGFGVLGVVDIKQKMNDKGVSFGPDCHIYEVCNPQRAKEVLEQDLRISTALPCRISIYDEGGETKVSTMLPTEMLRLYGKPELEPVAVDVEKQIKAIINAVAASSESEKSEKET